MKKNNENYKKKILITDDAEDLCVIFKDILEMEGYAVHTLSSGYETLNKIRKEKIDLLLLDIMLPDIDGIKVFNLIKKITPEIPIILYSADMNKNLIKEINNSRNSYFMQKPFKIDELISKVNIALKDN